MNGHMLVIPTTELMSLYTPEALPVGGPEFFVDLPARVNLTLDEVEVGVLYVSISDTRYDRNLRAERATYLLTGAYFRIYGTAVIDNLTESRALELMMEVAT